MEFKVLGPLEARSGDQDIAPTAAKPRQVLALLAVRAGAVVPVPTLLEELWGENAPRSALTTLQTYVLQLRRRLGPVSGGRDAKDVLATCFGGYVLTVEPSCVDAYEFERLAGAGERAAELGDVDSASRLLDSALQVWRGDVLSDITVGLSLGIEVTRLQEYRMTVLEHRLELDMMLGRHAGLVRELSVHCARHPLHENLRAIQMLALYRCGRQGQALEAYGRLRTTLVDELGIEPSTRVRDLQQRILRADPGLEHSASSARFQLSSTAS